MRVYSEIMEIYRVIQIKLSQFEKMSIMNNPNSFTMQLAVILPGAVGAYRESPGLPTVFDGRVKGKEWGREWKKQGWSNNGRNRGKDDGGKEGVSCSIHDLRSPPTFRPWLGLWLLPPTVP